MPTSTSTAVRQLSDGNTVGTVLGRSASDLIGFYGLTAGVAQPSGSQQAAIPANGTGTSAGVLTVYASAQTPSSVAALTVAEQSITVTGALTTDMVILNKPTVDAGIGLCSSRVSSANTIALTLANTTTGFLTPTTNQTYLVATVPAALQLSSILTPGSVAASTVAEQTFTGVTGVQPGMIVAVNKPSTNLGVGVLSARCPASNTLVLTYLNATAGTLTPTAAETYLVAGFNTLVAASQIIHHGANVGILALVAASTTSELSLTVAGLAATDIAIGVQKPTLQAGLLLSTGRISAANTYAVTFANVTSASLTPTASQVYVLTVLRTVPVAPMSLYTSATLTPTSVAANTTAEQTFTVTGLVSGQPVAVSPNFNVSAPLGVGIAGVRASATNTLAICFINPTAAALTPAAGTYTVAQFNQTTPTAGNYVQQLVSPIQTVGATLLNGLRAAQVSLGLVAGA